MSTALSEEGIVGKHGRSLAAVQSLIHHSACTLTSESQIYCLPCIGSLTGFMRYPKCVLGIVFLCGVLIFLAELLPPAPKQTHPDYDKGLWDFSTGCFVPCSFYSQALNYTSGWLRNRFDPCNWKCSEQIIALHSDQPSLWSFKVEETSQVETRHLVERPLKSFLIENVEPSAWPSSSDIHSR